MLSILKLTPAWLRIANRPNIGRANLQTTTTTTLRGWRIEYIVLIQAHWQS